VGNFYTSITLRVPDQRAVAGVLAGRRAFVSPSTDGVVMVFDEQCEDQDVAVLSSLAEHLSRSLACAALAVIESRRRRADMAAL
jgi:hypothetical protein